MRVAGILLLAMLVQVMPTSAGLAGELRIAAWNLEHLDDGEGDGCVGRSEADFAALARRIGKLDADVVAFQEVENAAAAHHVFPPSDWHVELSGRPPMERSRACWDRPEAHLGHLATGFAIRKGIAYRRNGDLSELGGNDSFQRWGSDITVMEGDRELRLLSVHLKSGCWGASQDEQDGKREVCKTLRGQFERLRTWADARLDAGTAFVIAGDFNRRLALPGDWAWRLLSPPSAQLLLLTQGMPSGCDPRFPAYIDHLVAGGGAEASLVEGSFSESPREAPHPDHCAVSAVFRTDP